MRVNIYFQCLQTPEWVELRQLWLCLCVTGHCKLGDVKEHMILSTVRVGCWSKHRQGWGVGEGVLLRVQRLQLGYRSGCLICSCNVGSTQYCGSGPLAASQVANERACQWGRQQTVSRRSHDRESDILSPGRHWLPPSCAHRKSSCQWAVPAAIPLRLFPCWRLAVRGVCWLSAAVIL